MYHFPYILPRNLGNQSPSLSSPLPCCRYLLSLATSYSILQRLLPPIHLIQVDGLYFFIFGVYFQLFCLEYIFCNHHAHQCSLELFFPLQKCILNRSTHLHSFLITYSLSSFDSGLFRSLLSSCTSSFSSQPRSNQGDLSVPPRCTHTYTRYLATASDS